jgi:Raf kinase inhibitor-like YbhB/YbcL family protein
MKTMNKWLLLAVLATPVVCFAQTRKASEGASLEVTSSAFRDEGKIPAKYTCDNSNVNPPLHIENVPNTAKSLVLLVDDPDAPGRVWIHWLAWNIDPKTKEIPEGTLPINAVAGTNDFGNVGYGGPCPPSGSHRYYFKVYALDTTLILPASTRKESLEKMMAGHVLTKGSLMGTYSRAH